MVAESCLGWWLRQHRRKLLNALSELPFTGGQYLPINIKGLYSKWVPHFHADRRLARRAPPEGRVGQDLCLMNRLALPSLEVEDDDAIVGLAYQINDSDERQGGVLKSNFTKGAA